MTSPGDGAIGALDCPEEEREKLARQSIKWICSVCGSSNSNCLPDENDKPVEKLECNPELVFSTNDQSRKQPPTSSQSNSDPHTPSNANIEPLVDNFSSSVAGSHIASTAEVQINNETSTGNSAEFGKKETAELQQFVQSEIKASNQAAIEKSRVSHERSRVRQRRTPQSKTIPVPTPRPNTTALTSERLLYFILSLLFLLILRRLLLLFT